MKTSNLLGITRADMEAEAQRNWEIFQSDVPLLEIRCINPFTRKVINKTFTRYEHPKLK